MRRTDGQRTTTARTGHDGTDGQGTADDDGTDDGMDGRTEDDDGDGDDGTEPTGPTQSFKYDIGTKILK